MVVGQHGSGHRRRTRQVTGRAEEIARPGRGVEHVVRVGHAVAVAVLAPVPTRARQELHRTHRAVPRRVTVPRAAVAVRDHGRPRRRPVQCDADDPATRVAVGVDAPAVCVPGLDPPDPREEPPRQMAGGLARRQVGLRLAVRGEHADGYASRPVGHSRAPGQRVRGVGLYGGRVRRRAGCASVGAGTTRVRRRRAGRRRPLHERPLRSAVVEPDGSLAAGPLRQHHGGSGLWRRRLGASRIWHRHRGRQRERTEAADEKGREHDGAGGARRRHAVGDPEGAGRKRLDLRHRGLNRHRPVRYPDHSQPSHRCPCRCSSSGGLPLPALTSSLPDIDGHHRTTGSRSSLRFRAIGPVR